MSQLLIIGVQQSYPASLILESSILEYAKGFDSLIYLYDDDFNTKNHDMGQTMLKSKQDGKFNPKILKNQPSFFKPLMEQGFGGEFIILLAKILIKYNLTNATQIKESSPEVLQEYNGLLKKHNIKEIDFTSYNFYIPTIKQDLEENIISKVILVGGESGGQLKEISLLLRVLDIPHIIHTSYLY